MNSAFETKPDWILDIAAVEALLRELQLREEVIDYIREAWHQSVKPDKLPELLALCNSWQEQITHQPDENYPAHWQALAVLSSFPEAMEKHRARGIPWEITRATLADFQRDARGEYADEGSWEFNRPAWMRNHVSGKFFEIGRLQYVIGTFGHSFRIYRDKETGEVIPLALPGRCCTAEGWMEDNATGFETTLEERPDGIYGYPASPQDGSVASTLKRIAAQSPALVDDQTTVLHIHIPSGGKLDRESCVESLRTAKAFFEKYFPEISVRAFCTSTWLLDRELTKVLSPDSNIVSFSNLFRPVASRNGNDKQLLERVFGDGVTWENCIAKTSLQKAIQEHHRNGGEFHSGAGVILPEDVGNF
jgi:hypothetical protein